MAKLKSGTRIYGTATIDTSMVVNGAIPAPGFGTGTLIVSGGAGISENLYVGKQLILLKRNTTSTPFVLHHSGSLYESILTGDFDTTASSTGIYFRSSSTANIAKGTGAALRFSAGVGEQASEQMRLDGNGNLLIGVSLSLTTALKDLIVNGKIKFGNPSGSAIGHDTTGYTTGSQILISDTQPTGTVVKGDIWFKM